MSAVGIDFGTTNSVVATFANDEATTLPLDQPPIEWEPYGFDEVLPSVFASDEHSRMTFGWAAKTSTGSKFDAVKRLFATQQDLTFDGSGQAMAVEEAATLLFAEIRRRCVGAGVDATQAVITVPANSKGRARHRTKVCAGMGGFEVLGLINEPTAAAMNYAQRNKGGRNFLVFDWGGGTLDVTVLQATEGIFIEKASAGLPRSGGLDFDARLSKAITESVDGASLWSPSQRAAFKLEVELAKIRLSQAETTTVMLPDGTPYRLTRTRFEEAVRPLIEEARLPLERCFRDLGVGPGTIDALVLVGGTCKIPAIRSFVRDLVGVDPDPEINPMTAVAQGAAIAAATLTGDNENTDFFVSTEHALGTLVLDPQTNSLDFSTLIPRNHKLPARVTETFYPVSAKQLSVSLEVVEGDPGDANPDYERLKEWSVTLVPPDDSERAIDLTYEYDVSGILHVTVTDKASGNVLLQDDVSYGIAEDKRRLRDIATRSREAVDGGVLATEPRPEVEDQEALELIQRAVVKVVPFLDNSEAESVSALVVALESSPPEHLQQAKDDLRGILAQYSYLF